MGDEPLSPADGASRALGGVVSAAEVKYRNLTKWWLAPAYFTICYIRKLGFLDGYAGFRFALFKAWYFSLIRKQLRMG